MSAQSSARSKRRQSALFTSKSLLPLPQLSISSIATSTPARANQKHTLAPLPTPQPPTARLLGTPARQQHDNTTFFGFSPGAEADETALLAVDYRSLGRREEQMQDELFDDTAILEEKAFANRRTSHEGDHSSGGLGALIFSNLIAGSQAHDALERLELGKRRDSDTSRRNDHASPLKRNASFTISTGGEYLVDYETDVRFGDDLQDLYDRTVEASPPTENAYSNPPPPSFRFSSSPVASLHSPFVIQVSKVAPHQPMESDATQNTVQNQVVSSPSLKDKSEYLQQDTTRVIGGPLGPQAVRADAEQVEEASQQVSADVDLSPSKQPALSPGISPASVHSAISTFAEPSPLPSMAEKRLARRMRRGLTSSMAILLSPVAEDRDREKSMSRSRSMLVEAIEAQFADLPAAEASQNMTITHHIGPVRSPSEEALPPANEPANTSMQQGLVDEEVLEPYRTEEKQQSPIGGTSFTEPVPLASVLAASLVQRTLLLPGSTQDLDVASAAASSSVTSKSRPAPIPSLPEGLIKHKIKPQPASKALEKVSSQSRVAKVPRSASDGPSYLKPTLCRSIQQREAVSFQRSTSSSRARPPVTSASQRRTASETLPHDIRQASEASTSRQHRQPPLRRARVVSAPIDVSVGGPPALIAKKRSVDDLFERRQRDGARTVTTNATIDKSKGKGKESEKVLKPQQTRFTSGKQTTSSGLTENVYKGAQDEALTVPRGFAFGSSRRGETKKRSRSDLDTTHTVAPISFEREGAPQRAIEHAIQSVPIRKARRVLPEENERLDGSDPEIGASVPLTSAALAAQEYTFETHQSIQEDEPAQPGPSESFDRTTHSQMLHRYLRELPAIETSTSPEPEYNNPSSHLDQNIRGSHKVHQSREVTDSASTTLVIKASEPGLKKQRLDKDPVQRQSASRRVAAHPEPPRPVPTRRPLQRVAAATANQVKERAPLSVIDQAERGTKPTAPVNKPPKIHVAPKVTDFTFQVVGQQQTSFQERLAAWQAREAEAARSGKPVLQPLALPPKDKAKQARKADKPELLKRKQPVQAKEFNWASDRRAKERKDWEDRLREKEQILAELAEIRRLEAEAAEMEAVRKMRAAQIPVAHAVPAFIKSTRRA